MGMYTGLRFKGVVKEEFRDNFEPIAMEGCWDESRDKMFLDFSCDSRSSFVPCGGLCYMPDAWVEEEKTEFARSYDKETGRWVFSCSLKNYEDTIKDFLHLVPYFVENVEYCEVFYEEWKWSHKYELVNGIMKLTNDKFIK